MAVFHVLDNWVCLDPEPEMSIILSVVLSGETCWQEVRNARNVWGHFLEVWFLFPLYSNLMTMAHPSSVGSYSLIGTLEGVPVTAVHAQDGEEHERHILG